MTTTSAAHAANTGASPKTTSAVRVGWVLTVLVTAFLAFDGVIHILNIAPVVDAARNLGFDPT